MFAFASGHGTMASVSTIVKLNKQLPAWRQKFQNSCTSQLQTIQIGNNYRANIHERTWPKHAKTIFLRCTGFTMPSGSPQWGLHNVQAASSHFCWKLFHRTWRHPNYFQLRLLQGWMGRNVWKYNIWTCRLGNCRLEHGRVHNTTRQYFCGDKDVYLQRRTWQVIFEPQCPQTHFFFGTIHDPYIRVVAGRHDSKGFVIEQTRKKKWWTIKWLGLTCIPWTNAPFKNAHWNP